MGAIKHEVKRAIYQIYKEKGRFPTLQEMCDALSFSADNTRKCMASLAEDGHIEPIGDWYRYPDATRPVTHDEVIKLITSEEREEIAKEITKELEETPVAEVTEEPIIIEADDSIVEKSKNNKIKNFYEKIKKIKFIQDDPLPEPKKRGRKPKSSKEQIEGFIKSREKGAITDNITLYGVPIYVIQVSMGVIGIGASIISIYYTAVWLIEFLPIPFALLLSSIMVGFSVFAFETVILFSSGQVTKSRLTKLSVSIGFIVLWIIVSCFSIFSTVAGQVNKNFENNERRELNYLSKEQIKFNSLKEQEDELKLRSEDFRKQMNVLNNIISGMGDISKRNENNQTWVETQYRLQQVGDNIIKTNIEINKIREEKNKIVEKNGEINFKGAKKIRRVNFYEWLSGVLGISSDNIQFWMSLFPAIFTDIISPVGIALALFLRNKYKKV